MTPAVEAAKQAGINFSLHAYEHDPAGTSWGAEAARKLGIAPERVFKTLVATSVEGGLIVGVLPVSASLSMKALARAAGIKKASMAGRDDVERVTGYVLGGVSPLGQKRRLPTLIDASAEALATIYVSAGRRGLEISLVPEDLRVLTAGTFAPITE